MLSFGSPFHSSDLVGHYCLREETEKSTVCPSTRSIPHLNLDTSRYALRIIFASGRTRCLHRIWSAIAFGISTSVNACHTAMLSCAPPRSLELGTMLSEHQERSMKSSGPFPQFHLPSECTCTTVLFSFFLLH